ncbi:hypothetical protein P8452_73730 [Trifolium repens]|nr:hypothetical protein P8452_73730 [Trifolium repens]
MPQKLKLRSPERCGAVIVIASAGSPFSCLILLFSPSATLLLDLLLHHFTTPLTRFKGVVLFHLKVKTLSCF